MEPIHAIEFELSSELATEVQRTVVRWDLRRGWKRDLPYFLVAIGFAALIIMLGLKEWITPGVGGGLLCVVVLFVLGMIYRRWGAAHMASLMALLGLHTTNRRVRIEFYEQRVRMETEFFRGEGAWTELEEVVIFSNFWLLRFSNGGQIMLPGSVISPALDEFIRVQAQEVSAPIHDA
jgi:hypothetical protein